jgi:hypothetical protein
MATNDLTSSTTVIGPVTVADQKPVIATTSLACSSDGIVARRSSLWLARASITTSRKRNINMNKLVATLGVALVFAALPTFAVAASAAANPIHIDSAHLFVGTISSDVYEPRYVNIVFTNEYGSPATEVIFAVETDGVVVDRIDDVGNFSAGIAIDHNFVYENLTNNFSGVTVAVVKARFADGTVWNNPDVADVPAAPVPFGVPATTR